MKSISIISAILACSIPLVAGCGPSGPEGALPTFPTTVKVNYGGGPVEGAIVSFINETAPAYGLTDANGVAVMKTYVEGDGAIAKIHNVTISKSTVTGGSNVDSDSEEYDPAAAYAPQNIEYSVPQKYSLPTTSKLIAEVKEVGKDEVNEIVFNLED